jgi:N-acetylmuramoyl-L-alanine amidase
VSFTHQVDRLGGPDWIDSFDCGRPVSDMRMRPHWASWAAESDEEAIYVSIHTNASPRGRPKGLTAFYGVDSTPPTPADPESVRLATLLDRHVYQTVRARDRGYLNRGTLPGDYSEISPVHNTLPAALLEMGFHDNPEEAKRLQTRQYREDAARGIVDGVIEWRQSRAGPPVPPITRDPNRRWRYAE